MDRRTEKGTPMSQMLTDGQTEGQMDGWKRGQAGATIINQVIYSSLPVSPPKIFADKIKMRKITKANNT